jgi:hypothetical protein
VAGVKPTPVKNLLLLLFKKKKEKILTLSLPSSPHSPPLTHLPPKRFLSPKPLTHLSPPPTPSASGDACTHPDRSRHPRTTTNSATAHRPMFLSPPPSPATGEEGGFCFPSLAPAKTLSPCLPIRESTERGTHPHVFF